MLMRSVPDQEFDYHRKRSISTFQLLPQKILRLWLRMTICGVCLGS